ncbi:MAG: hypothetical protein WCT53_03930 [Candidatus Gracilibacteria bacterium]|jgi:hypothetical protein
MAIKSTGPEGGESREVVAQVVGQEGMHESQPVQADAATAAAVGTVMAATEGRESTEEQIAHALFAEMQRLRDITNGESYSQALPTERFPGAKISLSLDPRGDDDYAKFHLFFGNVPQPFSTLKLGADAKNKMVTFPKKKGGELNWQTLAEEMASITRIVIDWPRSRSLPTAEESEREKEFKKPFSTEQLAYLKELTPAKLLELVQNLRGGNRELGNPGGSGGM